MCGITGFINLNNKIARKTILKEMTDSLYHRGPDGEGHFLALQLVIEDYP